ncbi:MAG TPA: hypothetical protein VIK89_03705 [Cytophagaceae bacterium]
MKNEYVIVEISFSQGGMDSHHIIKRFEDLREAKQGFESGNYEMKGHMLSGGSLFDLLELKEDKLYHLDGMAWPAKCYF